MSSKNQANTISLKFCGAKIVIPVCYIFSSILLAVFGAIAISFKVTDQSMTYSASSFIKHLADSIGRSGTLVLTITVLALIVSLIYGFVGFSRLTRRTKILLFAFALIISLSLVLPGVWSQGAESQTGFPWFSNVDMENLTNILILYYVVNIALTASIIVIEVSAIAKLSRDLTFHWTYEWKVIRFIRNISFNVKDIFKLSFLVFICWIPILIINGPVCIPMDSMVQLIQVKGFPAWDPMMMTSLPGYWFSDHNPAFDTLIYGLFDSIGCLLNNELLGLTAYTWIWAFFAAFALSLEILWVKSRFMIPSYVLFFSIGLVSFIPTCSSYMTILMKDSTWIPFFIIWMVGFEEICFRLLNTMEVKPSLVLFAVIFGVLAGLSKKTSVYISGLSFLILAFVYRDHLSKLLIASILPCLIVLFIIPRFLFPVLKIAPGGGQEALGTPIQQITYVVKNHSGELTKSDLDNISSVIDIDKACESFNLSTVDPAKQAFKSNCSLFDKIKFIGIWLKWFVKYPFDYVDAVPFLRNYFILGPTYFTNGSIKNGWEPSGGYAVLPQYSDCELSWTQEHISAPLLSFLNTCPVISVLGSEVLYVLWIPLGVVFFCFIKRRKIHITLLLPYLITYATFLMLPAYQTRYSITFLFCFLFMIAVPFSRDSVVKEGCQCK